MSRSGRDGALAATAKRGQGAEDKTDEDERHEDADKRDGSGDIGLPCGEPCEEDGERIFAEAERDVGEGLGRRSDCGANRSFASVSDEGDGAAGKCSGQLLARCERRSGLKGEQRGEGYADESVQRVPDEIERGNFVDEKTDAEEDESSNDDAPVRKKMKRRGKVESTACGPSGREWPRWRRH